MKNMLHVKATLHTCYHGDVAGYSLVYQQGFCLLHPGEFHGIILLSSMKFPDGFDDVGGYSATAAVFQKWIWTSI